MNWEAIGAIADIVGATAVLATLIYLALQISQNSRLIGQQNDMARAQTIQLRADSVAQLIALIVNSEASIATWTKVMANQEITPTDLDPIERTIAVSILTALRANLENIYLQHQEGFLPDDVYEDVGAQLFALYGPLLLSFKLPLTKGFRAELIRLLAEKKQSDDS
ncbi:MAG: hypothetical protein DRQ65_04760 [Gammaproteobacteria bacterium]|nr:MAG: hypothetical protein DRQ65_04760 [Gammaproteobacteria bacterium]